jgi:RNA ligase (TIGR02306 family)
MERKLASVRRIKEIKPHPNADLLDLAFVDGWQLVTAKENGFQAGDLVIYFEVDSFLPICDKFEWLRKSSYRKMGDKEGFRLKTIKLRGATSQGLILPLNDAYQENDKFFKAEDHAGDTLWMYNNGTNWVSAEEIGFDASEGIGVIKWDPPLPTQLAGVAKGNFPSFIPKTDQERIQNIIDDLDLTSDALYETTLKLDGSSCTIYHNDGAIGVCSRNIDLLETEENSFWIAARQTGLIDALKALGQNIAIQCELMGPGFQGNREKLEKLDLFIFDIYDIDNQKYLNPLTRINKIVELKENGYKGDVVPSFGVWPLNKFNDINSFLEFANTKSLNHEIAEGIVFKSFSNERHSFKVINNEFLLKEK